MHHPVTIGRVGALAFALGVGFAVGNGVAWADETGGTASANSTSSSTADQAGPAGGTAKKNEPGPASAAATAQRGNAVNHTPNPKADAPQSKPAESGSAAATATDTSAAADPQTTADPEPATAPAAGSVQPAAVSGSKRTAAAPTKAATPTTSLTASTISAATNSAATTAAIDTPATDVAAVPPPPEPAEAQPNVPLTMAPGHWKQVDLENLPNHPVPVGPPATAAILSVQWMRREAERTAGQQAPAAQLTTSDTTPLAALAAPTALAADDTAALQASFDALRPGDTLTLEPRTYFYSDNLYIRRSDVTVNGNGAMLYSTNPDAAAVVIQGNDVTLENINLSAPTGQARVDGTNQTRLVFGGDGNVIRDVTITGGASAGVYITGASNFLLERVTVQDTAADGVQITNGSHNGTLNNVTTLRTGDDAIAIVSYQSPALGTVHDIVINNPVVDTAAQRGLVVTGGERITFNNINVANTKLSGVWIGSQPAPFNTQGVNNVTVTGGTLTNTNSGGLPLGAVAVVAQNPNTTVQNVTVQNLTIVNTPPSSYTNVGLYTQGGTLSNIAFRNIAIWQPIPNVPLPFYTNANPSTYSATGFTMNGVPVVVTPAGVAV